MRWSWIALGAGAYLAFTLATLPAATAYHWLAPEPLRLSGFSGTVWSGGAALGSVPGLAFREARWNLRPAALLLGRLEGDFEARLADGFVSTHAVARPGRVVLEDVQGSTNLSTLRGLLPLAGDATARLSVQFDRFVVVDGWPVNALGTLRIGTLAVPPFTGLDGGGSGLIEVGSFALEFSDTDDEGLMATVTDTGGPLEVTESQLSLGPDRRYLLRGLARPRDNAAPELVQGLEFLASGTGPGGAHQFEFEGSL